MVSAATLHVVSTELAVGSFAMAGVAFLMAGLASHRWLLGERHLSLADNVAHFALAFGLLTMPLAIMTGIQSSPGKALTTPFSSTRCCWHRLRWASPSAFFSLGGVGVRPSGLTPPDDGGKASAAWVPSAWSC